MKKDEFIDLVIDIAKKHGYIIEINRYNQRQIDFGHKKLHEGHLAKLSPNVLNENADVGRMIEHVAPGRPCAHRPMKEIIAIIRNMKNGSCSSDQSHSLPQFISSAKVNNTKNCTRSSSSQFESNPSKKLPHQSMEIGEYDFIKICDIQPDLSDTGEIKNYMPQERYLNAKGLPFNKYGNGPFCRFIIPNDFPFCGVYAIIVDDDIVYIGECENLSKRYNMGYGNISPRNCYQGGQETNCRINNLILNEAIIGSLISLWFYETMNHKIIENALRKKLNPKWNRN